MLFSLKKHVTRILEIKKKKVPLISFLEKYLSNFELFHDFKKSLTKPWLIEAIFEIVDILDFLK